MPSEAKTIAETEAESASDEHAPLSLHPERARAEGAAQSRDASRGPRKVYPAFLRLDGEPVVVVGAGPVAAGKLDGLLVAGARVTVIAPVISAGCRRPEVAVIERAVVEADLDGARFVVAAATPDVNREVGAWARARGLFVNAVDDADTATAYLGGVVRRGGVTVAISTGGAAPALAALLRESLDALLPEDLDTWIAEATRRREAWRAAGIDLAARRELLRQALIGGSRS